MIGEPRLSIALAFALCACAGPTRRESVAIDQPCVDGGDPDEDVDLEQDPGRRYTPRRLLPADAYSLWIRVRPNKFGYVYVRSRLVFPEDDHRNVIGKVPSGTVVAAAGPMKNSTGSMGIGYSIRVVDGEGRSCQGFVSATVVDEIP